MFYIIGVQADFTVVQSPAWGTQTIYGPLSVGDFSGIVAIDKFLAILRQMLGSYKVVKADYTSFEDAPKSFYGVGMVTSL